MKKGIGLFMSIVIAVSLAACGGAEGGNSRFAGKGFCSRGLLHFRYFAGRVDGSL